MSNTRKKKSQSKKAIEAALQVAREHARIIEAAQRNREQAEDSSVPRAGTK